MYCTSENLPRPCVHSYKHVLVCYDSALDGNKRILENSLHPLFSPASFLFPFPFPSRMIFHFTRPTAGGYCLELAFLFRQGITEDTSVVYNRLYKCLATYSGTHRELK